MSTLPKCLKRHTTEIDPKQTHVIDDKVELSFRLSRPKLSAMLRTITPLSLCILRPWASSLLNDGRNLPTTRHSLVDFFYAVDPAFHGRIIDYDRAVRNRILVQRHLRITDSANFDDLRTAFLSPFGMGAHSTQSYSAGSSSVKQQRDPCHKWNRGTCAKSESECFFAHCCDRRACRGNHRRSDCLVRDGIGTTTSKPPRDALGVAPK